MAGEHVKERVMAGFCKTCNAPVPIGSGFCPSCGSAFESVAAAPGYVAAPPKKSGSALKIVLIVIAVVVVLGVAGVAILGYVGEAAVKEGGPVVALGGRDPAEHSAEPVVVVVR